MAKPTKFQLPENLTIAAVQGLHREFEGLVDQKDHDEILVEGGAVRKTDTAGIQLLLAFCLSARERQIKLSWNAPSEQLVSAATTIGLKDTLGIH